MKATSKILFVLGVVVAVLLVIFVAQNADYVVVTFFTSEAEMPLSVLLFITFMIGVFVALIVSYFVSLHSKHSQRKQQRIADMEDENRKLRTRLGTDGEVADTEITPSDEQ